MTASILAAVAARKRNHNEKTPDFRVFLCINLNSRKKGRQGDGSLVSILTTLRSYLKALA